MRPIHIDFVNASRPPALGWLVLLAGLTLAGIVTDEYLKLHQKQEAVTQAREAQARRVADQERQRLAALPPTVPPYVDDKRWQHAAAELALPWLTTLRAIERTTKPPVFLVGFKSDPVSGRLQLDAEAPTFEEALAYVSALQAKPELAHTQLLAHDESPDQQGRPLVRFSLQTQWVLKR